MLGTLILGIAAGWGTPYAEPKVKAALENVLLDDVPVEPMEMRLFSFAVCLLGAALLSMIFAEPHAALSHLARRQAFSVRASSRSGEQPVTPTTTAEDALMIPGELFPADGTLTLNPDRPVTTLMVANTGDRPVQVGSHYHFAEANSALDFDRDAARGQRLDIAAGTAVRFEPGQRREVNLIPMSGARRIYGFNQQVMGDL